MMIHDPKKQAALIIDAALPQAGEADDESASGDIGLAQDIIDAVKSGSAEDLAMALRAFHSSPDEMDESAE